MVVNQFELSCAVGLDLNQWVLCTIGIEVQKGISKISSAATLLNQSENGLVIEMLLLKQSLSMGAPVSIFTFTLGNHL